jgi:hypothetical protein
VGGTWHIALGLAGLVIGVAAAGCIHALRQFVTRATTAPWEPLCTTPWAAPAVFVAAALGVFLAVPDTEAATVVLGSAVGITGVAVIAGIGGHSWRFDSGLPLGMVAIVWAAWSGTTSPNATNAALIGAIASSAVLVLAPMLGLAFHLRLGPRRWSATALVVPAFIAAITAARAGAVRSTEPRAIAVSVAVWVVTVAVLTLTAQPVPEPALEVSGPERPSP